MLSTFDEPIDAEFDDPGVMDPGGSVEPAPAKPKRTRAPNKPKGGESSGGVKASYNDNVIFVLLNASGTAEVVNKEDFPSAAAKAIQMPDVWTLLRAEKVEPKITF